MDVPTPFYYPDIPSPIEEGKVSAVRKRLLRRVQVSGLVPTDVAIGFIVAGIDVDPVHDCYFGLPYYLVIAGALSLSIATLNALNSFYVFNKCSELMYDLRQQKEGTDERKKAGMKFGIAHAISVGINFVSLSIGLYYATVLGSKIAGVW